MSEKIAVIGAGLIGRAWAIVFARAGRQVCLHDISEPSLGKAQEAIRASLKDLEGFGLVSAPEEVLGNITYETDLARALEGVGYVQECGPESIQAKREIYAALEASSSPTTVLASSTSGIAASHFTDHLKYPQRCLVSHPVNPPYLIPLVEVVPTPDTDGTVIDRTMQLMEAVQQVPILVKKEVQGFILNRLQGALLNEALRLFREGYVSAADLDKTVKHGLGLRWSFMGPFETIDLNAPKGVVDYGERYGPLYRDVDNQRGGADPWHQDTLAALSAELRSELPAERLGERQEWRDRRLMALKSHHQSVDEQ